MQAKAVDESAAPVASPAAEVALPAPVDKPAPVGTPSSSAAGSPPGPPATPALAMQAPPGDSLVQLAARKQELMKLLLGLD